MKKVKGWLCKSGMFSKIIVLFCLGYIVRIVEWGIHEFEETQMEATTLISAPLAIFGGELLFLCLKRIFAKQDKKKENHIQPFTQENFDGNDKEEY